MALIDKKRAFRKSKARGKRATAAQLRSRAQPAAAAFDPAADAEERHKIGKTLDVDAFLAFHKRNTANRGFWKTQR
jgi:hypothetical protein